MHTRQKSVVCNVASVVFAHRRTHHVLINVKRVESERYLVIFAVCAYQLRASLLIDLLLVLLWQ